MNMKSQQKSEIQDCCSRPIITQETDYPHLSSGSAKTVPTQQRTEARGSGVRLGCGQKDQAKRSAKGDVHNTSMEMRKV